MADQPPKRSKREDADRDTFLTIAGIIVMFLIFAFVTFLILVQRFANTAAYLTAMLPTATIAVNQILAQLASHRSRRQLTDEVVITRHDLKNNMQNAVLQQDVDREMVLRIVADEVRKAEREQLLDDPKFKKELTDMLQVVFKDGSKAVLAEIVQTALEDYHNKFHGDKGQFHD